MMHPFTKTEIYEALVERHTAAYQEKLDAGHVAIAGLGGLGSNVAFALARLGVGHLHLIDFDRVDLTNLNRQQYLLRHVGMYKTDALKEQLLQINPYLDITTDCVKVTSENLKTLFADADIICEAFDNAETKCHVRQRHTGMFSPEKTGLRFRHGRLRQQQHHPHSKDWQQFLSLRRRNHRYCPWTMPHGTQSGPLRCP